MARGAAQARNVARPRASHAPARAREAVEAAIAEQLRPAVEAELAADRSDYMERYAYRPLVEGVQWVLARPRHPEGAYDVFTVRLRLGAEHPLTRRLLALRADHGSVAPVRDELFAQLRQAGVEHREASDHRDTHFSVQPSEKGDEGLVSFSLARPGFRDEGTPHEREPLADEIARGLALILGMDGRLRPDLPTGPATSLRAALSRRAA